MSTLVELVLLVLKLIVLFYCSYLSQVVGGQSTVYCKHGSLVDWKTCLWKLYETPLHLGALLCWVLLQFSAWEHGGMIGFPLLLTDSKWNEYCSLSLSESCYNCNVSDYLHPFLLHLLFSQDSPILLSSQWSRYKPRYFCLGHYPLLFHWLLLYLL